MKRWLHVLAALVGLLLAAVVVTIVFGQADREGSSQQGDSGTSGANGSGVDPRCGQIGPADLDAADTIERATDRPPTVVNEQLVPVRITDAGQAAWVARVHAALGLCTTELAVHTRQVEAAADYPSDTPDEYLAGHAYAALEAAMQQPLARPRVAIELARGDEVRTVTVSSRGWQAWKQASSALRLPDGLAGLVAAKKKLGLPDDQVALEGW